jgi:hypothetical protein
MRQRHSVASETPSVVVNLRFIIGLLTVRRPQAGMIGW